MRSRPVALLLVGAYFCLADRHLSLYKNKFYPLRRACKTKKTSSRLIKNYIEEFE